MLRKVPVENGQVKGLPASDPRITSFKGIPFAAPPVGENRWRAPQPAKNWDGVLYASEFEPISLQHIPGEDPETIYTREWNVDSGLMMTAYPGDLFNEEQHLARAEQAGVEFFKFLGVSSLEEARNLKGQYGSFLRPWQNAGGRLWANIMILQEKCVTTGQILSVPATRTVKMQTDLICLCGSPLQKKIPTKSVFMMKYVSVKKGRTT